MTGKFIYTVLISFFCIVTILISKINKTSIETKNIDKVSLINKNPCKNCDSNINISSDEKIMIEATKYVNKLRKENAKLLNNKEKTIEILNSNIKEKKIQLNKIKESEIYLFNKKEISEIKENTIEEENLVGNFLPTKNSDTVKNSIIRNIDTIVITKSKSFWRKTKIDTLNISKDSIN